MKIVLCLFWQVCRSDPYKSALNPYKHICCSLAALTFDLRVSTVPKGDQNFKDCIIISYNLFSAVTSVGSYLGNTSDII